MRRIPRTGTFGLIAFFALFATVLPLAAIMPGLLSAARSEGDQRSIDGLNILARQVAVRLRNGLAEQWREHEALVLIAAAEGLDERFSLRLNTAKALNNRLAWMGVAGPDGRVLAATGSILLGADVSARPWFRAGLQGAFAGDVHEAALLARFLPPTASGEPVRLIDFAGPLRRADGSVLAVLGSHVEWSWVRDLVRSAPSASRTEAMLISRDGVVLAGPAAMEGRRLGLRAALSAQQGVAASGVETWEDGQGYMTIAVPITPGEGTPGFGWSIVVRQDPAGMIETARNIVRAVAIPLAIAAAIILVFGLTLARAIARPLGQLARGAQALAENRGDVPIPDPRTTRELAQLASALARIDRSLPATAPSIRIGTQPIAAE